ncbi:histone-like nucleoid-structuring protein Lsr2 [Glutamicibacter ardleyensis]|uniref:histone-like nucleoid-structuring protein Lsr2 n=1 Tax=Glutamicibacter ardleyensis TaxID=225894 RepID=UPI003FCFDE23
MAQVITLVDDIDGNTDDVKSVRFLADGVEYQIDLGKKNRAELDQVVAKLIEAGAKKVTGKAVAGSKSGVDTQAVREWANANGVEVNERGRLSSSVLEAYANRKK